MEAKRSLRILQTAAACTAVAAAGFGLLGGDELLPDELAVFFDAGGFLVSVGSSLVLFGSARAKGGRSKRSRRKLGGALGYFPSPFMGATMDRLSRAGLSARQVEFIGEFMSGRSMKEISVAHSCASSTVRNTFRSIYRKLHLSGSVELATFIATLVAGRDPAETVPKEGSEEGKSESDGHSA